MAILFTVLVCYGFSFVIPIGGADMPVVISLLNSLPVYRCGGRSDLPEQFHAGGWYSGGASASF
ncbi:MAG: NAD(P)(+) transhydrogenase (Re/Si-specific) subunit beta [Saprospiraceae bacterium]